MFLGALEKGVPAERAAFLDAACRHDAALRSRVEGLLREQEQVGSFLETPALAAPQPSRPAAVFGPTGTAVVAVVTERPGDRIGRYKLLQVIGEGGAGVVYMAEQEEPVRRRVALKVIKLGMDTRQVIARFEAERQALAMMDHPNIARVLDAGATETGRPFFVMELVRGIRITDYCDENNLPTHVRLKLFIQVCQAIQHAHQKGIIHRDIKPSNILVTLHDGVPVPKVIDFGIAKATEHRLTEKTLFTEFSMFIGTPAYMSPEQAQISGLDIDTRSDIYSLGVLLYELLTGRPPFDPEALMRDGVDECRRTIREREPIRPSTRVATLIEAELTTTARQRQTEAPRLIHLLSGDLDWIAMRCLEKDRTRRYATANDLAQDIQRYLDGEPVSARPPSNLYRFQKFVRRNRGTFAAAAAIAITLITGASISLWQAVRATRAERQALAAQKLEVRLREQAEEEWVRAEQEKTSARLNEYVADINLAQQSLAAGNLGRAFQLLDKHRPVEGEPDLRGFEWRYLWLLCQGDDHIPLPTQESPIMSLALSPGGEWLAVGLWDKTHILDLRTRALVTTLPKGGISMAFLPDGKRLATASPNTTRIWRGGNWLDELALTNQGGPIALSPDGTQIATLSHTRPGARLWDTGTGTEKRFLAGASAPMAFSPDGRQFVADSRAGLTLWSLANPGPGRVLADSTNLSRAAPWSRSDRGVAFSPDGRFVVAARNTLSERGVFVLSIWDVETGSESVLPDNPEHIEHTGIITALAFSPDGNTLATASMDHSIRLWDFAKRRRLLTLQGHLAEVRTLAFSADSQMLVSGAKDGGLKLWPLRRPPKDDVLRDVSQPVAFSKNSRTLAALAQDGSVVFLDLTTGESEQQFPVERRRERFGPFRLPPSFSSAVSLSEDLRTLAVDQDDGTVKLWNTKTRDSTTLRVSDRSGNFVALSPDGALLLTRGPEWALRLWNLRTGTNGIWPGEADRVLFSPDGRKLATLSRGNAIQVWDVATLTPLVEFQSDEQPGFGLTAAFSWDSRLLAVAYQDDSIRLWDATTGRLRGVCTGHKQGVLSVAFAPDGKTLATSSDDSTLKLWNVATQQELLSIRRLGGALRSLRFSPDGRMLVGGGGFSAPTSGIRCYRVPAFSETDRPAAPPVNKTDRPDPESEK